MTLPQERLEDLSVFYYIQDLFSDATYINIVDGFPTEKLVVPTVAVEANVIESVPFEMGSRNRLQYRTFSIDVFAKNKSQRDDISYRVINALEEPIPVNNYNEGFPPTITPTQLGCLLSDNIRLDIVIIFPEFVDTLYYRSSIRFTCHYNKA
jgi:hypothetical protein